MKIDWNDYKSVIKEAKRLEGERDTYKAWLNEQYERIDSFMEAYSAKVSNQKAKQLRTDLYKFLITDKEKYEQLITYIAEEMSIPL